MAHNSTANLHSNSNPIQCHSTSTCSLPSSFSPCSATSPWLNLTSLRNAATRAILPPLSRFLLQLKPPPPHPKNGASAVTAGLASAVFADLASVMHARLLRVRLWRVRLWRVRLFSHPPSMPLWVHRSWSTQTINLRFPSRRPEPQR